MGCIDGDHVDDTASHLIASLSDDHHDLQERERLCRDKWATDNKYGPNIITTLSHSDLNNASLGNQLILHYKVVLGQVGLVQYCYRG